MSTDTPVYDETAAAEPQEAAAVDSSTGVPAQADQPDAAPGDVSPVEPTITEVVATREAEIAAGEPPHVNPVEVDLASNEYAPGWTVQHPFRKVEADISKALNAVEAEISKVTSRKNKA